jgi:hypothetical protein
VRLELVIAAGVLALSCAKDPPAPAQKDAPAPRAEPQRDSDRDQPCPLPPSRAHPQDPNITPDRCVHTSYSYAGCTDVYPREARECLRRSCASLRPSPALHNIYCYREAEMMLDGTGGAKQEAEGLQRLEALCADEYPTPCAILAEHVLDRDRERGLRLFHRGCDNYDKSPAWTCEELRRKLGIPPPHPEVWVH